MRYQQALSLYNQGDYEGAFDLLYGEVDQKCLLLKAECKKQITDQYLYLIKEALESKEYVRAWHLKETYLFKYNFDSSINAIQVPNVSLESVLKSDEIVEGNTLNTGHSQVEVESMAPPTITNIQTPKNSKERIIALVVTLSIFVFGGIYLFYLQGENVDKILDTLFINKLASEVNNNLAVLQSNNQYGIITIDKKKNVAYCLDKDKKYLYVRYNLETGQIEERELSTESCPGIQHLSEMFYIENLNSIIFIGGNGWNGMGAGMYALKLNLSNEELNEICFAREVRRVGDYLLAQQMELIVDGDNFADNDCNFYDEYYDYNGNLIDGKTIHGKGSIGKYVIEMSLHVLDKEIRGWYKYEGHTNYMTIQGKMDDNGSFEFLEFNDKMEPFGRFVGQADFEQGTLMGTWNKDGKQLDFFVSK